MATPGQSSCCRRLSKLYRRLLGIGTACFVHDRGSQGPFEVIPVTITGDYLGTLTICAKLLRLGIREV